MRLNPLSWFSDWANQLGIPVWIVYVGAGVVGLLLLKFLIGG